MAGPALVVRVAANPEELRRNLKEGRDQIETTSAATSRLATSFNGEKLVQSAHAVTAAINKVGVATLSTAETSRSLDLLDKGMDKLLRTGQQVPVEMSRTAAELRRMVGASDAADASVLRITGTYRKFDGILQSLGINIGPYVKGLEDIANLATKGAAGLGLLGGAVAAAAAAFAGWKLGEHIDKTYKFSDAIAKGWAVLLGYGDVAQETAMAVADSIDLMGKAEANWRRNTEAVEAATQAAKEQSDATRENWRITEGNTDAMARLARELDAAKQKKVEDARATFAASQAQSIFGEETDTTTEKVREQTAALNEREASLKRLMTTEAERKAQQDAFMNAPTLNDQGSDTHSFDLPQLTGIALDDVVSRFRAPGEKDPQKALWRALDQLEAQEGRYKVTDNASFFAMQRDQALLAQLRALLGPDRPPGFASGVENFRGGMAMVGERGPELVRLPRGSDVIPNHQLGGGGLTIIIQAGAIQQMFPITHDRSTVEPLMDLITKELALRYGGGAVPVGV